jgi:hypothetical protein
MRFEVRCRSVELGGAVELPPAIRSGIPVAAVYENALLFVIHAQGNSGCARLGLHGEYAGRERPPVIKICRMHSDVAKGLDAHDVPRKKFS